MADGQAHVVGGQRVGDVDHDFALQVAHRLQGVHRVGIAGGEHDGIGANGGTGGCHGRGTRIGSRDPGRLRGVASRDADLVAGADQLLDKCRAHVAGADDSNLHVQSFRAVDDALLNAEATRCCMD